MSTVQAVVDPAVQRARDAFAAMQAWPHWPEIASGAEKEYGMPRQEFDSLLPEYQRFMALSAAFPGLGMLGPRIDILWHSHILNTIRYREFNEQYVGRFVNHLPCSSYAIYGVGPQAGICNEPPATCEDPWPAPPDPSPVPPEPEPELNPLQHAQMRQAILDASPRFVAAYTHTFGYAPPLEFWPRTALVEAIAQ